MIFFQFVCLILSIFATLASSIGSESGILSVCSKFDFEEKLLEKLVRLEHKMEVYAEKMKLWEESVSSSLDTVVVAKKKTETFIESMREAHLEDQTRFDKSFLETIDHFKLESENKTEMYERKMNTLLDSFSFKIQELSKDERKRESAMQVYHHHEQNRFNASFDKIVENFQIRFNKSLQEIALNQQKVALTACHSSYSSVSASTVVQFSNIKTNIGITDLSSYKSTGKFVCTVAGLYHVSAVMMSNTDAALYYIYKNNDTMITTYYGKVHNYQTRTRVLVTMLDAGDEITVRTGGSQYIFEYSCFTIVKLN
ncbi:uncharacterized protein LOC134686271 [Mytilus trossulus]|uniref:uncharacterized protein LOC134686271 n=1 Tax=Mytilus trossulus TaxID=6551 RepID=UPI003007EF93